LSGATKIKDLARKQHYGTFVSAAPPSLISLSKFLSEFEIMLIAADVARQIISKI
jgi:hypothetical protein